MKLTEYLKLRGVNANALTQPEAKLLGINTAVSGWVGKFAHVEIPPPLAALAAQEPGKDVLKEMAKKLLSGLVRTRPVRINPSLDQFHRHEAIDRCDLFARMVEDNLLSHPAVQANAEVRVLIEVAITSLAEAYQVLGQD